MNAGKAQGKCCRQAFNAALATVTNNGGSCRPNPAFFKGRTFFSLAIDMIEKFTTATQTSNFVLGT